MTKKVNQANSSRPARRDPKSQSKQTAARDGTAGSQQNRRGGKSSQNVTKQQESITNGPTSTPPPPPQEEHVPINGFNAAEVTAMLKRGVDSKIPVYKPEGKETATKGSPWGTKGEDIPFPLDRQQISEGHLDHKLTIMQQAQWPMEKISGSSFASRPLCFSLTTESEEVAENAREGFFEPLKEDGRRTFRITCMALTGLA